MRKQLIVLIAIVGVSILGIFGIRYYLDARIPRATAILQIHPGYSSPWAFQRPKNELPSLFGNYGQSEFEIPLNDDVLTIAAQILELEGISLGDTFSYLKNNVKAEPVRGEDFLKIIAKHPSRRQAALIANTIGETIGTREAKQNKSRADSALEALDEELELQAGLVAESSAHLDDFRGKYGIDDATFKLFQETYPLVGFENAQSPHVMKITKALMNRHPDMDPVERSLIHYNFSQLFAESEEENNMLREMKIKQEEARVILKMPRAPVTIHERAK